MHEFLIANCYASQLQGRMNIAYLAMPRLSYIKTKDPKCTFSAEKLQVEIAEEMSRFYKLTDNPAEFEARYSDVTLEYLLFSHESFVLIESVSVKWGRIRPMGD